MKGMTIKTKRIASLVMAVLMLMNLAVFVSADAKVSAKLWWTENFETGEWADASESAVFNLADFAPGSEAVRYLKVENDGNLAFSYQLFMTGESETLADVIDVYTAKDIATNVTTDAMTSIGKLKTVIGNGAIFGGSILPDGEKADSAYTKETIVAIALKMADDVSGDYIGKATGEFNLTLGVTSYNPVDKFETKFVNSADYLYRVGNKNPIKLGSLFKLKDGMVAGNVKAMVNSLDKNANAAGVFTANLDWTESIIQFSGTGVVEIVIEDDGYSNPASVKVEVVDAVNVATYNDFKDNTTSVLVDNITMSSNGCKTIGAATLYGNGFTFDVTAGEVKTSGYLSGNYVVGLAGGTLNNVKIIGKVYTEYGATRNDSYNRTTVATTGNSKIVNSYISNCAAPVRVNGGSLEIVNSTLKGGNFANLDIRSGNIVLDNVTTINQVNSNDVAEDGTIVVGLGVIVYYENIADTTTVEIKNGITQYNHISEKQTKEYIKNSSAQQLTDQIFKSYLEKIQYNDGSDIWVNTGIVSMTDLVGDDSITDVDGYIDASPSLLGHTGYAHTKKPTADSILLVAPEYKEIGQATIAPTYNFDHTKNLQAEVSGSNDYCKYEENINTYTISMDEGDTFNWDTSILTVSKAGKNISYTVAMNGTDYTGKKIPFTQAGNYTVTYTYTDDNNYTLDANGNITTYSATYTKEVDIIVTAVKASIRDAVVTVGNTAIDGIYVQTGFFTDYDYKYRTNVIEPITVTDYDESGKATEVDLTANIQSATYIDNNGGQNYGENGGNGGTITITYKDGRVLTVKVGSWNGPMPSTKTVSIKTDDGIYLLTDGASDNKADATFIMNGYTFKGNSGAIVENNTKVTFTWDSSSSSGGGSPCVTGDTLVTLADGTEKRIDEVTYDDQLLVWDFFNGEYAVVSPAVIFDHGYGDNTVLKLTFEDGTEIRVVDSHQFFDAEANSFVSITENTVASMVGREFVKMDSDGYNVVKLENYEISTEYIQSYGIITALHYNLINAGMLSTNFEPVDCGLYYYFEIGENMTFDKVKMEVDIEKYGLYTYEDFDGYLTEEFFDGYNVKYMKVAVGKGQYTYQGMLDLIQKWFVESDDVVPTEKVNEPVSTPEPTVEPVEEPIMPMNDEPEAGQTASIVSSGNKVVAASYVVTATEMDDDGVVTFAATGTAPTGYASFTIDGDTYYTVQLAPGETISVKFENLQNAKDTALTTTSDWGTSSVDGIAQDSLVADGAVIDFGELSKSENGKTITLYNTTKYPVTTDVYVAVFDANRNMLSATRYANLTVEGKDEHPFTELELPEGAYAEAFVWAVGTMIPVLKK